MGSEKNGGALESCYLRPVSYRKVSDQIFDQLRDIIFRGKLKPGEKLPPERELAYSFQASRPSVKAAITRLVNLGIVEQKQGQGTYVRSMEWCHPENPLRGVLEDKEVSILDLLEVRRGLEVQAVGLAAERATENDIKSLDMCLQDMLAKVEKGGMGSKEDVAFHMGIAYATGNSAQIYLMKNFYELLFQGISESRIYLYETGNLSVMNKQHADILQAIRDKNPVEARDCMENHIRFVMQACRNSIKPIQ